MTTIHLTIDGKEIAVPKGTTVYAAAKTLGREIPIFCYQDRMPPFGACRVCLVEVDKLPKLQASCTLEATEGMVVSTQSQRAIEGRKGILELLLINHPLDCPICDRGGECPLQEHTLNHGPGLSRFFEEKRRFKKAIPLGPVLMLDRERCIVCARCTRFGDHISGDHALEFIDRGFRTEVGTPDGGPAASKFIGNTIQICPVGALTSNVYRFRARPWDNDSVQSTCTLCPVGCSLILDSRDGEILRTRACENREVNDMWLCDKGWFGYEFSSHRDRLTTPLIRRLGELVPASWEEALTLVASKMQKGKANGRLAAFGGNPLTIEENYLFQQLFRKAAGVDHIDHRIGMPLLNLAQEGLPAGMQISIGECEELSAACLLGLDLTEEFPVIWLRLKQAINKGAQVQFIGHYAPEITHHLASTVLHAPGQELEMLQKILPEIAEMKGALFVGRQYLAHPNRTAILAALLDFKNKHPEVSLNIMEGSGNSMGARYAGMHPNVGPQGVRLEKPGLNALQVLEEAGNSGWQLLYVAGANPVACLPHDLWKAARAKLDFLVVQDLFLTETAKQADVVLPTLSYLEKEGSFLNIEGRLQKLKPGKFIPENIYSDGVIFSLIGKKMNTTLAVPSDFLPKERLKLKLTEIKPLKTESVQAELRATFAPALFDHGVRMRHDPHVLQLAKEPFARVHPNEALRHDLQEGKIAHLSANGKTVALKIQLDKRVAEGTVVLPLGFKEAAVWELDPHLLNGLPLTIEESR